MNRNMNDILITPEVCMMFLVWSYYYHGVMPEKNVSYSECDLFHKDDIAKLDEIKSALFKCFEEESVIRACFQFRQAKKNGEPCPYPQDTLDKMFACAKK